MNKRIFELAKQADLIQWDTLPSGARTPDHESVVKAKKFAELIVKECMEQCSKALVEHTGQPSVTHNYAVGLCQDNIKEHFGVEE